MRLMLLITFLTVSILAGAQDNIEEVPYVRILALDKSTRAAEQFNQEIASGALDYNLAFVDTENSPTIRYVYKTTGNETLRIDYKYDLQVKEGTKRPQRVVIFQRISGNLQVITAIYNYLFNASISPATIMSAATVGSPVGHAGKIYHFTFQPDDYNPGYWVMSFVK